MPEPRLILQVAIETPLRCTFDYLPPLSVDPKHLVPGMRVTVPFGKSRFRTGLLIGASKDSVIEPHRLKRVISVLDNEPLLDKHQLDFLCWCANYYHYPVGAVLLGTLPALLSQGRSAVIADRVRWELITPANPAKATLPTNAVRLRNLLDFIANHTDGCHEDDIRSEFNDSNKLLHKLAEKGFIRAMPERPESSSDRQHLTSLITLNEEQARAVKLITQSADRYQAFLLNGVTGSGKTEVYIHSINAIIQQGHQALVLVPEIGLTPQLIKRFKESLTADVGILHSGLSDRERMQNWLSARAGKTRVILGTRSAIWTPLRQPGIIIVDEEHDQSYKQQEGFRYSARDLAIARAQHLNIPVLLGSATPSLETAYNVTTNRYRQLELTVRAGSASMPSIRLLDLRSARMCGALCEPAVTAITKCLEQKEQVLLFLNRRGYAPVLMCHECGWTARCRRCDFHMTLHKETGQLVCHHCLHQETVMKNCGGCQMPGMLEIGHGTQRLQETLAQRFPGATIARIDRDSTRRKGSMNAFFTDVHAGKVDILIGTQMLAKGHHFPGVTLAVIVDADQGIYSIDYRAGERMAQIITQVSGRAGRGGRAGQVLIQTHHPEHPLLQALLKQNYTEITALLLDERKQSGLPPYSYQVLLRAEANTRNAPGIFLQEAREQLPVSSGKLEVYGPYPAPMEKRAGRYRMQLLLQMQNRKELRKIMDNWVPAIDSLKSGRRVRWSVDVDPQDMM